MSDTSIEKSNNEREEKQKRIIELRNHTGTTHSEDPNTPFNSIENFGEIAKEVKTKMNPPPSNSLVNSLNEKLMNLQNEEKKVNKKNENCYCFTFDFICIVVLR
eukprot:TRINITY_DN9096_c0_g1_i1.p1 TRINITY_DN9096_c0_g1~~TRINITY_DN9096_c0_g1_i1.p1  ORF type:complete len:104 (-),score=27.13 TRINITY_DN9096_c0_g1_i1:60-371(-)